MEWSQSGRASRFQKMEVIIALKQRNVEKLEERCPGRFLLTTRSDSCSSKC